MTNFREGVIWPVQGESPANVGPRCRNRRVPFLRMGIFTEVLEIFSTIGDASFHAWLPAHDRRKGHGELGFGIGSVLAAGGPFALRLIGMWEVNPL